jgi:hypothetical protein
MRSCTATCCWRWTRTCSRTSPVHRLAARSASGTEVNTLSVSEDAVAVRMRYPENERLAHFSDDARVVVSEPLADLPGLWREVPAATALVIDDTIEQRPLRAGEALVALLGRQFRGRGRLRRSGLTAGHHDRLSRGRGTCAATTGRPGHIRRGPGGVVARRALPIVGGIGRRGRRVRNERTESASVPAARAGGCICQTGAESNRAHTQTGGDYYLGTKTFQLHNDACRRACSRPRCDGTQCHCHGGTPSAARLILAFPKNGAPANGCRPR